MTLHQKLAEPQRQKGKQGWRWRAGVAGGCILGQQIFNSRCLFCMSPMAEKGPAQDRGSWQHPGVRPKKAREGDNRQQSPQIVGENFTGEEQERRQSRLLGKGPGPHPGNLETPLLSPKALTPSSLTACLLPEGTVSRPGLCNSPGRACSHTSECPDPSKPQARPASRVRCTEGTGAFLWAALQEAWPARDAGGGG